MESSLMPAVAPGAPPRLLPPPPPKQLPPPPFQPVRLSPRSPWFLSAEQRMLLHSSVLVSSPTPVSAAPSASASPLRPSWASVADSEPEEVPDSAPPSPRLGSSAQADIVNAPARLRSTITAPPSFQLRGAVVRGVSPSRDDRPWQDVTRRRRPRSGRGYEAAARPAPRARIEQEQASRLRFISKTKGKCSRCLAPSHRAYKCTNQMRCLTCDESGHRERLCPRRRKSKPPAGPAACASTLGRATSSPGAHLWAENVAAPLRHEDNQDVDVAGGGRHECRCGASESRGRQQGPRGVPAPSPRRRGSSYTGLRRQRAASPPLTMSVDCDAITSMGLRDVFAEQARLLRDDLNAALDRALQPFKEDVAALRSWLGRATSFLERAEELAVRFDIASPALARAPLPCSPVQGPLPLVAVGSPSTAMGLIVSQSPMSLHGGDEAWNEDTVISADASPTFTSVTPSSSPPSSVGSQRMLFLSCDSPYLVRDISTEFEPAPLGMPVTSPLPAPAVLSEGIAHPPSPQEDLMDLVLGPMASDSWTLQQFMAFATKPTPMSFLSTPAPKKTKGGFLDTPRRSGRIAQQKKKLPSLKSKGARRKRKSLLP